MQIIQMNQEDIVKLYKIDKIIVTWSVIQGFTVYNVGRIDFPIVSRSSPGKMMCTFSIMGQTEKLSINVNDCLNPENLTDNGCVLLATTGMIHFM